MDSEIEIKKLAEECGELVQILMKTSIWGIHNNNPKTNQFNGERLMEEMGDVLCHLKRVANVYQIGWDRIQRQSHLKNTKVNKYHYKEEKQWEIQ